MAALSVMAIGIWVVPVGAQAVGGRAQLPQAAPQLPPGTVVRGPLATQQELSADVALAVPDAAALNSFATSVSTPGSSDYGHYLTPGEFAARFGPAGSSVDAVRQWLSGQGLSVGSPIDGGLLIPVKGSVAQMSAAFGTSFNDVNLPQGQSAYANTSSPSVPADLAGVVRAVVGLDDLSRPRPLFTRPAASAGFSAPQSCHDGAVGSEAGGPRTYTQLASTYDITPLYGQGRTGAGITVGVLELEPLSLVDVSVFESCYGISVPLSAVSVDGGPGTIGDTTESVLDIDTVAALAPQASIVDYQGPNNQNGEIDVFAQMAAEDRAQVISTSWGNCELENSPPNNEINAAAIENTIFQQMAAQGQTVVASSGDSGAQSCWPTPINPANLTAVNADDPASQPFVTGVGGTILPNLTTAGEAVWNDCQGRSTTCAQNDLTNGATGGGRSTVWPMPTYQSANGAIGPDSTPAPCPTPNPNCREVPDVAADAAPNTAPIIFLSAINGWTPVGGTSVAAPIWGAIFALVDQGCGSPTGFANPKLYSLGAASSGAFNDVTSGNNDLTGTNGGNFAARPGYDMATGWGSPNTAVLLSSLQPAGGCPAVTGLSSIAAPVGAALTVTGSSLGGATAVHFGPAGNAQILSDSATALTVAVPAGAGSGVVDVTVTTPNGTSAAVPVDQFVYPRTGLGYSEVASDGGLFSFGNANFYGSMGGQPLNQPVVAMANAPDDHGYWEVATDGGLFAFGDAGFFGSMGGQPLNQPIVGMATTPFGKGYWEVASDGGIFSFGDAGFFGSMGGQPLNQPVVGIAATADGQGYWEVASDGGLFAFGDANFFGSMGGRPLNQPVVGIAATADGRGYWEVASDGGLFAFGDANFFGSMGGRSLNQPIVGLAATPDGRGYWEVASDGGLFAFGDAGFFGSMGGRPLNRPVVGLAST